MLLIDGVRYEEWKPTSEADYENLVKDHVKEIFSEQSIYLDIKPYLKSVAGFGSVPDGLTIIYEKNPQWHIVEVELSNHSVYEHIVPQVARFTSGINNPTTQRKVVDIIYNEILKDELLYLRLKKAVAPTEIHKFISDLISKQPILTVIIEKETPELEDVRTALAHLQIKVIEFKTFVREKVGLEVHAHFFEPIFQPIEIIPPPPPPEPPVEGRVTVKDLLDTKFLKVGQVIYKLYKGQRFEGKVLNNGSIRLAHNDTEYGSPSAAAKPVAGSVDGWTWWYTTQENGEECVLDELRKEYRRTHPSNP